MTRFLSIGSYDALTARNVDNKDQGTGSRLSSHRGHKDRYTRVATNVNDLDHPRILNYQRRPRILRFRTVEHIPL